MKKILVVEDDPLNLQILSDFLGAHGYEMSGATTGPEGIERFFADKPDLALIDVQLPRKNGFEVCFDIKRTQQGQSTPILLMSAVYTDTEHANKYTEKGLRAEGYLLKPFDLGHLLERVHTLIGKA